MVVLTGVLVSLHWVGALLLSNVEAELLLTLGLAPWPVGSELESRELRESPPVKNWYYCTSNFFFSFSASFSVNIVACQAHPVLVFYLCFLLLRRKFV